MPFTVREHHEHPVRNARYAEQQLSRAVEHRCELSAAVARDGRIERIEPQFDRAGVDGERRQDMAATRERDESDPIARQVAHQAARFAFRTLQTGGRHIFGEHRPGDIHRDDEVQRFRLCRHHPAAPARIRQGDGGNQSSGAEYRGRPLPYTGRPPPQPCRPAFRVRHPCVPRPRGERQHCHTDDGRKPEHRGRIESHQGTRTTTAADNSSSMTNAARPINSGTRNASSNMVYRATTTGVFSS